jgi:alpha-glucosidase
MRTTGRLVALCLLATSCGEAPVGRVELTPVTVGDMTVRAWSDGGFALTVGGRTILTARQGALAARDYEEDVRMAFGVWSFLRDPPTALRPRANATLRRDGDAVVLAAREGATTATLRLRRASPGEVEIEGTVAAAAPYKSLAVHLDCAADAHFLGFGEQFDAVDHRGRKLPLWVSEQGIGRDPDGRTAFSGDDTTTYFPVPFFLDPRGFGVAVDTEARVEADLCSTRPDEYVLAAEDPRRIHLRVYTGPTVADVMRDWTALQGRTSAPPRWSVDGVWLAVQGGPANVRAAVARARAADLPLAAIWSQDWLGRREFAPGQFGVRYRWSVDEALYPDLGGLIRELHGQGVRFFGYFNPFLVPEQDLYEPAVREGYIARTAAGEPYTFPISVLLGGVVDLTNPRAVTWFQGYARTALGLGIDGWMHDFGEWLPHDALLADGSDPRLAHNGYPTRWQRAAREVFEAARPDGDWVMFSRSGWLRTSTVSQVVWCGDQEANWGEHDGLPTVIPAMVSLGLAGVGYVTHDVAGFSGGPSTKELFQRWVELAAFTPIFRTHEGLRREQNWSWDRDDATRAHFVRFAKVHRALAPRIAELGAQHRATGMPIVRALGLAFPDEPRGYGVLDEYMLGDDLLVAPVVTEGAVSRRVYFPRGRWFDVWDASRSYEGPTEVTVEAPIGRPPVFSRTAREDLRAIQ